MIRWQAVVTYRTDAGPNRVIHDIEELDELRKLIERGPCWYCIEDIRITLVHQDYPGLTIEQAERL